MSRFLLARTLQALAVVVAVTVLVFVMLRLSPGDPATIRGGIDASPELVREYARQFGTDKPIFDQFVTFVTAAAHGDLGTSIRYSAPVSRVILDALPATLALAGLALLMAVSTSLLLGIAAARAPGSLIDHGTSLLASVGQAMPVFWAGLLLIQLFAVQLRLLPTGGYAGFESLILPASAVALSILPAQMRVVRASMNSALGQDYVRTTRAFGLKERRIVYRYALRNAALPVLTIIGVDIGYLLGGVIVVEVVFSFPGIGQLAISALGTRDYPLIQVLAIGSATVFAALNVLIDVLYARIDPRVTHHA